MDDTLDIGDTGHVEAHELLHTRYNNSVEILSGTFAARPAFGAAGTLYVATDTTQLFRDSGTAWVEIANDGAAISAAITAHQAVADPHTQYQKESEKSAASGYASLDGSTKVPIAELPTGTTGTTVALGDAAAGLITTHEAAADPHPGYVLNAELASHEGAADPHPGYVLNAELTSHEGAADPHPGYLTQAEGDALYEDDGAVATHAAAADPHTGYVLESLIDAAGDLIVGSADNTVARLPAGAEDEVLTIVSGVPAWAAGGAGGAIVVYKTADETNQSSAVQQDDDHLFFTLDANGVYTFEALLHATTGNAATDLNVQWVEPDGTFAMHSQAMDNPTSPTLTNDYLDESTAVQVLAFSTGTFLMWHVVGVIIAGVTGGTFKLQWASANNSAVVTLKKGSWIRYQKLN